jgi:hypothetical protein
MSKRAIRMLKQPETDDCGETCVAMVTGHSVQQIKDELKHDRAGMIDIDFHRALTKYCIPFKKSRRYQMYLPETAILIYVAEDPKSDWGHAVVLHRGRIYDPAIGIPIPADDYYAGVTAFKKLQEFIEIL